MDDRYQQMSDALDAFFEETRQIAEQGGYIIEAYADDTGDDLDVVVSNEDDYMPSILVEPKKRSDGAWEFKVEVSFPIIEVDDLSGKLKYVFDDWKPAAALADNLASIKFDKDDWIS